MKRKYYRYILYILLVLLLGAAGAYFFGNFPLTSRLFSSAGKEADGGNLEDSLKVIRLNTDAFNLRLSNPQKTTVLAGSALKIAKSIKYFRGVAESYRIIGIGTFYEDKFHLAIKNYVEALKYYQNLGDIRNQAKVYNNIGNLYSKIEDPQNSVLYFTKSLNIARALNDDELTAGLYFNIGRAYEQQRSYKKAVLYFDKSYQFFKRTKDEVYVTMYFQNSGLVYFKQGDFKKAESLLTIAVSRAKKLKLYPVITGCYLILARIYIQNQDYSRAKGILDEGIQYADILKDQGVKNQLIYLQYEVQNGVQNYKGALAILANLYKTDSLQLKNKLSQNIGITTRHYIQKQKLQEKELIITKQKYREATFRWVITLSFLVFILCAVAVLIGYLVREKQRKRKEVMIQNEIASLEQKALQAMMNPHFVFNVMNSIQHFINEADSQTANQVLSGFARLARKHLEICMNPTISVQEEMVYLQLYLSLEKIRFSDKMEYQITIDENIDTEEIMIPSMLVQPFIENAIWHGIMPKDEGGLIKLNFDLVDSDLLISIIDDGVGLANSEKEKKAGHISRGMTLIRERVGLLNKLNKRQIYIDQQQTGDYGTIVMIRIPA